ncbi:MAG: hypothetical protein CL388_00405 [Acidiferrobacteraceae bacterium]|nr:hypothetical protein [Acidiferrobacteraceae bacterium]MDP6123175.1 STAS domain-containing protein [Arenicellales bacterium]MDP6434999.1 STAS domain-containing protein [Arenicellales bacterium]MDP6672569.1 STAS domain-containing protein [Arenicellales bacterium]MDP6724991.1 STAS domain-containing protein [Arenicellales bacterium]
MKAELKREVVGSYQVTGELTFNTVASLSRRTPPDVSGGGRVVVDLSQVVKIDSAGLALIVDWTRQACQRGGGVAFSGATQSLRHLLEVTGLDKVITLKN